MKGRELGRGGVLGSGKGPEGNDKTRLVRLQVVRGVRHRAIRIALMLSQRPQHTVDSDLRVLSHLEPYRRRIERILNL